MFNKLAQAVRRLSESSVGTIYVSCPQSIFVSTALFGRFGIIQKRYVE